MTSNLDAKIKALGIVFLVTVALILLQMSSFAPLPVSINGFLKGFAVGLAIVLMIAQFVLRKGKTQS